jgi:hypothetical protein
MVEAFGKLPAHTAILDGKLCLIDPRKAAHFYRLMAQMRTSAPDESQLMFPAFDLLHQDCEACRYPSASATCIGYVANLECRSCARYKPFQRPAAIRALVLKASCRSD